MKSKFNLLYEKIIFEEDQNDNSLKEQFQKEEMNHYFFDEYSRKNNTQKFMKPVKFADEEGYVECEVYKYDIKYVNSYQDGEYEDKYHSWNESNDVYSIVPGEKLDQIKTMKYQKKGINWVLTDDKGISFIRMKNNQLTRKITASRTDYTYGHAHHHNYTKSYNKPKAQKTGQLCPKCNSPLVKRNGKYGQFIGCSNYPTCKYIKKNQETNTSNVTSNNQTNYETLKQIPYKNPKQAPIKIASDNMKGVIVVFNSYPIKECLKQKGYYLPNIKAWQIENTSVEEITSIINKYMQENNL